MAYKPEGRNNVYILYGYCFAFLGMKVKKNVNLYI